MQQFYMPLLGGAMIGLGAVILMAGLGKIAGFSTILGGVFDETWRWFFVFGALFAPFALYVMGDKSMNLGASPASHIWLIIAGLLVGVGTSLANGCTSGHGICGLSRLSPRSLVATITFMLVAIITVWVTKRRTSSHSPLAQSWA
jgi:uncharacterized protein